MFLWVILQIPNNMIDLFWLISIDWLSILVIADYSVLAIIIIINHLTIAVNNDEFYCYKDSLNNY